MEKNITKCILRFCKKLQRKRISGDNSADWKVSERGIAAKKGNQHDPTHVERFPRARIN